MAKQPRVWDGSQWQELAVQVPNMSNYAYLPTTPVSGFRNKIINGGFDIWQRGTSFSNPVSLTFTADRVGVYYDGSGATRTVSQQTNTDVIGSMTPQYFIRFAHSVAGTGAANNLWYHRIEDVRTFSNQTVTLSFYAKAAATTTLPTISIDQVFGTGGSASVTTTFASNVSISTTWTKYIYTINIPTVSGKTIGANSYLALEFRMPLNATFTIDFSQVQLEAGSVATPFEQRPIGTELALCQRYYYRLAQNTGRYGAGYAKTTTTADVIIDFPVTMRTNPSALEQSGTAGDYLIAYQNSAVAGSSVPTFTNATVKSGTVNFTVGAVLTAGNGVIAGPNGANSYLGWSAEL